MLLRFLILCQFSLGALQVAATGVEDSGLPKWESVQSNRADIAFRRFGQGEPLVIINGGPGRASDSFVDLAQSFAKSGRQSVLFDQRGTGHSLLAKTDDSTVRLDLMLNDLEQIRKKLGVSKLSLLGHSFGGMYAMAYAAKFPEAVKSLILSASGGVDLAWLDYVQNNQLVRLSPDGRKAFVFWTSKAQKAKEPEKSRFEALRATIPAYVFDQKFAPDVEAALVNKKLYFPKIHDLVWKDLHRIAFNLRDDLKKSKFPALVIDCRQDFLGEEVPMAIHQSLSGSELVLLNGCSHYPWLEQPDSYFGAINRFLS